MPKASIERWASQKHNACPHGKTLGLQSNRRHTGQLNSSTSGGGGAAGGAADMVPARGGSRRATMTSESDGAR